MSYSRRPSRPFESVYIFAGNTYRTVQIAPPSTYRENVVIITPLMKYGGKAVLDLLDTTPDTTRIILISMKLTEMEMLRSQLDYHQRIRLTCYCCELNLAMSIHKTTLNLAKNVPDIDIVIHLIPYRLATDESTRFKALLCANTESVKAFRSRFKGFYGEDLEYFELEHTLSESADYVSTQVSDIVKSDVY